MFCIMLMYLSVATTAIKKPQKKQQKAMKATHRKIWNIRFGNKENGAQKADLRLLHSACFILLLVGIYFSISRLAQMNGPTPLGSLSRIGSLM